MTQSRAQGHPAWHGLLLSLLVFGCSPDPPPAPPLIHAERLDRFQVSLLKEARQKVVARPDSAQAWGKLGQQLDALDFFDQALLCYEQAARMDPQSVRWHHLLGLRQLQDQPAAALSNLQRAVELAGTETDAPRIRLGQALVERGRFQEARACLEPLLEVDPHHAAARLELARMHLVEEDLAQAEARLEPCLSHARTTRPALRLLSQIRQRQGDAEAALELSRRAASMPRPFDWPDPYLREVESLRADKQDLKDHINQLIIRRSLEEAETSLNRFRQLFPKDADAWLFLGRLRLRQRQCREAEMAYRNYLRADPQSLNGMIQLALSLLCQKKWGEAIPVLELAIMVKPDFAEAYHNLGHAQARLGMITEAVASYEKGLQCRPGDAKAHAALAEIHYQTGREDLAQGHLRKALDLDPQNAKARQVQADMSGNRKEP